MTLPDPRDAERPREGWREAYRAKGYGNPDDPYDPRADAFQDGYLARDAEVARLREALERQADNMAFVLNNMSVPDGWYDRFCLELDQDRHALGPSDDH